MISRVYEDIQSHIPCFLDVSVLLCVECRREP
jgi:hypothetical protein